MSFAITISRIQMIGRAAFLLPKVFRRPKVEAKEDVPVADRRLASFNQVGLWIEMQRLGAPHLANRLWVLELEGRLNPARLERSLSRVIARHEALHCRFEVSPEGLIEIQDPARQVALEHRDETGLSAEDLKAAADSFGMMPFDLKAGPLVRFRLTRTGPRNHRLLCGFHHFVFDGMSWPLFRDDLAAELAGRKIARPAFSYARHSMRQRNTYDDAGSHAAAISHWRKMSEGTPAPWRFPVAPPVSPVETGSGETFSLHLSRQQMAAVRDLSDRFNVSPFRVVFAAFSIWLAQVAGRDSLRLVTALRGRAGGNVDDVIGFFTSIGLVNLAISREASLAEVIADLSGGLDEAVRYEDVPLSIALRELGGSVVPGDSLFSPVSFTRLARQRICVAGGLELRDHFHILPMAERDLSLYFRDIGDTAELFWNFQTAKFDRGLIERFSGQCLHILDQLLATPGMRVGDLELLDEAQLREVVRLGEGVRRSEGAIPSLPLRISDRAQAHPHSIAVIDGTCELTYGEVETLASHVARRLSAAGVRKGSFVPLLMAPSAALLVGEIAAMKIGAAFVPLDPSWPRARVDRILDRLQADAVLVEKAGIPNEWLGSRRMEIGDLTGLARAGGSDLGADEPFEPGQGEDPLYCIFTSGSTGLPKGALNAHRGVLNRFDAMTDLYGEGHVALSTAGPAVDSLVWQLFWPLATGGTTVIGRPSIAVSAARMAGLCKRHSVTITDFVPSVLRSFVDDLRGDPSLADSFSSLKAILVGGEAMEPGPAQAVRGHIPGARIFNTYGPTETAIGAIFHEVDDRCLTSVPIGRPLPNVDVLLVDDRLRPVALGMPGELCLGGACLGLGYLRDPEETAKRFVELTVAGTATRRFYRTGDRARMRADGVIDYLGRMDDQISLNGNRIEPGEVEAALASHPQVEEAAVALNTGRQGKVSLVAYVSALGKEPPTGEILREHMLERLPRTMIPVTYLFVPRLPRMAGGKLDREALKTLPVPEHVPSERGVHVPANSLERQIIGVWEEVLGRTGISRQDNFFLDLGGDSLQVLQCEMRLEDLGLGEADIQRFYENPVPADLARALSRPIGGVSQASAQPIDVSALVDTQRTFLSSWKGVRAAPDSLLFRLNGEGSRRPLFWCCQAFHELERLAEYLGPEQPVIGMRSAHLIRTAPGVAVPALAERYAGEMADLLPRGAFVLGGNCQAAAIAREIASHLVVRGRDVERLILLEDTEFKPYGGNLTLIYGRDSHLNPYGRGASPDAYFAEIYPDGFDVRMIPGAHGQYFREPNIAHLAETLRADLPS